MLLAGFTSLPGLSFFHFSFFIFVSLSFSFSCQFSLELSLFIYPRAPIATLLCIAVLVTGVLALCWRDSVQTDSTETISLLAAIPITLKALLFAPFPNRRPTSYFHTLVIARSQSITTLAKSGHSRGDALTPFKNKNQSHCAYTIGLAIIRCAPIS
jgi:hypothetical protein